MGEISDIPGGSIIIDEVMKDIRRRSPNMLKKNSVRENFSDVVEEVFSLTYKKYKSYELSTVKGLANRWFPLIRDTSDRDEARDLNHKQAADMLKLAKSLSQSRVSRAGKAFEIIVQSLLKIAGIDSEPVTVSEKSRLGRVDLVIPDRRTAIDTPDRAHFLSLKTTLRERWKQVVQEQKQGQRTHLITILQGDETITDNAARGIVDGGVFLYVPDRIKKSQFPHESRIRGLSELPASVE